MRQANFCPCGSVPVLSISVATSAEPAPVHVWNIPVISTGPRLAPIG